MPAVQRILLRYARNDRETLEAFLSVAIDLLDLIDGDPDLEDSETGSATVNACGREIVHGWHFLQTEDDEEDDAPEADDHGGGDIIDEGEASIQPVHLSEGF